MAKAGSPGSGLYERLDIGVVHGAERLGDAFQQCGLDVLDAAVHAMGGKRQ